MDLHIRKKHKEQVQVLLQDSLNSVENATTKAC